MHTYSKGPKTMQRFHAAALAAAALVLPLAGCSTDDILNVNTPNIVDPGSLENATGAAALRAGAIGDFAFAYSGDAGGTEGMVLLTGLMADEFFNGDTFSTRQEPDQRNIDVANGTLQAVFRNIQRARESARRAARALAALPTPNNTQAAEMKALEAFAYVLIGEAYCNAVPFSEEINGAVVPGTPRTNQETFQIAIAKFDSALALTTDATISSLARVGKARAQVDLGQYAAAATTVASVPTSFRYVFRHSETTSRQQNGVMVFSWVSRRWTTFNREGGNGLPFHSDPRTAVKADGNAFDGTVPLFLPLKYPTRSTSITLADGIEARLIEAEAALQANNTTSFLNILNSLRATPPSYAFINTGGTLPPLTDPGTQAGRVDLLFAERAYWMFGTSHRLGDLRRLVRQYSRGAETVFPTGSYFKGGSYGGNVNIPVPVDEQNNPNFDRAACVTSQA